MSVGSMSSLGAGGGESRLLLKVLARDPDCSAPFGSVCRYELQVEDGHLANQLAVDQWGQIWVKGGSLEAPKRDQQVSFQVIAFDCGGRKSAEPARVQLNFTSQSPECIPGIKGKPTRINYRCTAGLV